MKKVMVYAYTTFNLGDDLFIKVLCERYPNIKFVLYAPKNYKLLFKDIDNIIFYPSDNLLIRGVNFVLRKLKVQEIFRTLIARSCDASVCIGGSLFMQGEDWKMNMGNMKKLKIGDKPFFLLGSNFGPYEDKEFYWGYKEIFKEYTDICFRDKYSYDLFNDLNNVRMADDIIFNLKSNTKVCKKNVVISVIKPSARDHLADYDEVYYEKMKDIAIYFVEKGYKVTLISFCEIEGDREAVESIINLIPENYINSITKYIYKLNIEEALDVIAESSFVVATRFHSMIIGWVYNKPVFPIVYSEKMTNVMRDIGFNGLYSEVSKIDSIKPEEVFKCMETNLINVATQMNNAEKHFEKLDEYLLN